MPRLSPVVVTGAAGNLGSRLVPWLEAGGRQVIAVDAVEFGRPGAVIDDLTRPGERAWMSGAAAVVHLAGMPDQNSTDEAVDRINVGATRVMVDQARRHGVQRFVLASSVWAMRSAWDAGGRVGNGPAQPDARRYSHSKAEAERVVAESGLSSVVLRIGGRVPGDARPVHLDDWEDSVWLGWSDFLAGVGCALDASVDGVATVTLVSRNRADRWDLTPGRDLIGFEPTQWYDPVPPPSWLRRALRKVHRLVVGQRR